MTTIGRYRVVDVLGRGAFASVFLGHDDELQVPVAIKVLGDNWAADPEVSERFLAEARLLRRIADRRVVRVYDVGTIRAEHGPAQPYFVMDHVAGGTLADRAGTLAPREVLHLCAEGARAVQVLHDWGVIHRDVKPSNLLVDESRSRRRVVVSDLGTAKAVADATGITMTMGTPAYMAPEQVFSLDGFDHRADVYALGVLTYVMLTGDPPYPIRSVADLVGGAEFPPPPAVAPGLGLPAELDDLLRSAVAVDRNQRPASAADFADRLDAFARAEGDDTSVDVAAEHTVVRPPIVMPRTVRPDPPQIPQAVRLREDPAAARPAAAPTQAVRVSPPWPEEVAVPRSGSVPAAVVTTAQVSEGPSPLTATGPVRVPVPLVVVTSILVCLLTAVLTWLLLP